MLTVAGRRECDYFCRYVVYKGSRREGIMFLTLTNDMRKKSGPRRSQLGNHECAKCQDEPSDSCGDIAVTIEAA